MLKRTLAAICALLRLTFAGVAPAAAESDERSCTGVDFDLRRPLVVAKVIATPRTHYIKSAWEDEACPAATATCAAKAYLVPGDLVLGGRTRGPFTCISYQSPRDRRQIWTNGWVATTALEPVVPTAVPKFTDWLGTWVHTGGEITIERARNGKLSVSGEQVTWGAQEPHNGVIGAEAKPAGAILAFAEDGGVDFDKAEEGACQVRMQRIGALLVVEDNGHCGGSAVSFTGLYRRKP